MMFTFAGESKFPACLERPEWKVFLMGCYLFLCITSTKQP